MGQKYIWEKSGWPQFKWDSEKILPDLAQARKLQGQILAQAKLIGLESQAHLLVQEALTTSAIEGEKLNKDSVRSSVARRLGLPTAGLSPSQRPIDGLVEMLADATTNYSLPLSAKRLWGWQAALFPTGYSGLRKIKTGGWRIKRDPMEVVSGRPGKEKIHFVAPPATKVPNEMKLFFEWWRSSFQGVDGILRSGIAHFWFVTVHPFEDGNGRIARALTDMALAQDEQIGFRLYSLSAQIMKEREAYYEILETSQKRDMNLTPWLLWFLKIYQQAIQDSNGIIQKALTVAKFWQFHQRSDFNERQIKIISRLLEAEPEGFEGGMTNRKYVSLTSVSRETAKRDLSELEKKGVLKQSAGQGRSTSYTLILPK